MSKYYDKSVKDELIKVRREHMRELHTGIDCACSAPFNREGVETQ